MLYKRGRYYWTRFKWMGGLIDRPTRASNKRTASKIEAKIRSELAEGNYGILQPRQAPTLAEFLKKDFLPFTEGRFKDVPKSLVYYVQGVARLLKSEIARCHLNEITSQDAAQFAAANGRLAPATINQALRTLRRSLKLAEEWGKLDRAPKVVLAKGENQRDRVLTDEEARLYLTACAQPWKDVATIMYCLGTRPSEIYTLRWEQITLTEEGLIQITKGKSKAARRVLPLVPAVQKILEYRHRDQGFPTVGWVFPTASKSGHLEQGSAKNQHHKAIQAVNKAAKEEAKKSGITNPEPRLKSFAPYCLRHTALTNLAPNCDTFALRTIAGHSSIAITQRYIHPQAQAITQAFAKIAERQKGVTEGGDNSKTVKFEEIQKACN